MNIADLGQMAMVFTAIDILFGVAIVYCMYEYARRKK